MTTLDVIERTTDIRRRHHRHRFLGRLHTGEFRQTASYRRRIAPFATLSLGLDLQERHTTAHRRGSQNLPPREGDVVVFGQRPTGETAFDDWSIDILGAAPYLTSEITLGRLTVTPGLRFEPTLIEGNLRVPHPPSSVTPPVGYSRLDLARNPGPVGPLALAPNPRLALAFRLFPRLTLTAAGGIYGQPPDPEDMSPVFGNPSVGMLRAIHVSGGFSAKLRPTLTFEAIGFWKRLDDLVSRNALSSPPVGQSLTQDGRGRTYGLQVLLRQELLRGFFGWITYTLSRSVRWDHPDTASRLFDYDQTHVLGVLGSYDFGRGWEFGSRFRYATGAPRTPVIAPIDNATSGFPEPIFGAHNSIRIPAFYQFDARLEKAFVMKRNKLSLFLDVQNLTNRKNPEELVYNQNYTRRGTITGLPTLAIVGARMEF